ncbi:voltage-gated hydrogen channel 1 [Polypterus senegalus]|uniref:voltage-gated hydrogen channel 1 n=1 Tax=Polypterus senegalus TaxID=55291 RepID=UPI001965DF83|nr:voltage-gated hydrogen channel 1 [Polypterus senegalus]XP_039628098.1 voltage-gated hydrogen channel 1 [Polypterus senegalus]XP_039628099.1 voltage-gated hydrogen channel 1 [Polypterus senegalus]XP_039628100.1 voltage-gated hydrogen channel 1 [Polypterus senegalus]XP_039628101.1 voltage-gated hydrogen channel 1 [Polypterus senegalus]
MSKYLRHFTAVGDDHHSQVKQHYDQFNEHMHGLEVEPRPVVQAPTLRDSLKKLFSSHRFQVVVVCLVVLDALFVLCELLMDLSIIKADEHKIAPQVFHYLSLALLSFFMVELFGKLYAFRLEFFHHKFEVFDGIVVIVSFILDIIYISHEDAFDGVGLLILLRLWRVARIINGILVSVQSQANQKIEKLKEANDELTQRISELENDKRQKETEIERLCTVLRQNGITIPSLSDGAVC